MIASHDVAQPLLAKANSSHRADAESHVAVPEIANPLTARMHKGVNTTMDEGQTMVAHALRGEGFDASEDGTGRGTPIVPVEHPIAIQERAVSENPNNGPDGVGCRTDGAAYTLEARSTVQAVAFDSKASSPQANEEGVAPTLRAMNHANSHANAGGQLAVAFDAQAGGNTALAASDEVAGALHGGGKHGGRAAVATRWAVRRLTPTECERLQGFPDGYTSIAYRTTRKVTALELLYIHLTHLGISMEEARRLAADGPRYKALGNSMATNAMEFLGDRIELVREILAEQDS